MADLLENDTRIHIVPIGDSGPMSGIHVVSLACWCHPLLDEDRLAIHNAHDCREAMERQGQYAESWLLVREQIRDV